MFERLGARAGAQRERAARRIHKLTRHAGRPTTAAHRPGDRVSLVLPNSVDFIVGFLACTVARAIAAPLNPDAAYAELANYIADAGAKVHRRCPRARTPAVHACAPRAC